MKKIIMISGSSFGAGKDTVGEMLEKNTQPQVSEFATWHSQIGLECL